MSEVRSMAVDQEFDEASAGWPPKGVRVVCSMPACGEVALETGRCVSHQTQLVQLLAHQFGDLVAASFAEVRWYAERLGSKATWDQGIALKRAVVSSYSPLTAFEHGGDQAKDEAWREVRNANQERGRNFFSSLPDRIDAGVEERATAFEVVVAFVVGMVAGAVFIVALL